jgi:hypothetical protein
VSVRLTLSSIPSTGRGTGAIQSWRALYAEEELETVSHDQGGGEEKPARNHEVGTFSR